MVRRAALASVVGLLLAGAAPVGAVPVAREPRPQGTILYASTRSGNWEIYAVRADGTYRGQLTRTSVDESNPVFSPDGRRIMFEGSALSVMNADGSRRRRIVRYAGDPAWAPDSRRIAYYSYAGKTPADAFPLVIVSVASGRRVVVHGRFYEPSWSPDGKRLVVTTDAVGDRTDLVVVQANGHGRRTIRRGVGAGARPQWLPNGLISFAGNDRIDLVRPDGRGARPVRVGRSAEAFAWSPDARRIAFVDHDGKQLHVAFTAGGRARDITPKGGGTFSEPAWSPDGRWLVVRRTLPGAATRFGSRGNLFVVAADGSSSRRITPPFVYPYGGDDQTPSWRPRGATPARLGARPAQPLPSETASRSSLRSAGEILGLAADGGRVAIGVDWSPADCWHLAVWKPGVRPTHLPFQESCPNDVGAQATIGGQVALAGQRVAWVESGASPSTAEDDLHVTTLGRPTQSRWVDDRSHCNEGCNGAQGAFLGDLDGDGSLLVYDTWSECGPSDPRNGPSDCVPHGEPFGDTSVEDEHLWRIDGAKRAEIRAGSGSVWASAVDAGRIVVREVGGPVDILRANGSRVCRVVLPAGEALATGLSGSQLVVRTKTALNVYDAVTGAAQKTIPLGPLAKARLVDFDHGIAVLVEGRTVHLLRLADGHDATTMPPGRGPVYAQLEAPGLFTGYTLRSGKHPGRVDFTTRAALERRLDAAATR